MAARPPESTAPAPAEDVEGPSLGEEEKERRHFWRELPVLIVIAFAIALIIKTFFLQAFYIPSASMEPTLLIGDRVLVEKVGYRFSDPDRGDVVVFEKDFAVLADPALEEDRPFYEGILDSFRGLFGFPTGSSQDFIKRVMAVEGDTIQARDGTIRVNGEVVEEPYLPEGTTTTDFGPVEVPGDEIFVMGDNRSNSDDSRNFGPIGEDKVVGRAFVLIWPPADFGLL